MVTTRTVRDATREVLRGYGMTTIFGNPGSTEMGFFSDWPDDFRYFLGLQEATAVAMADGWAQANGNAAFVNLHSAAGLGNALGNVFTAYRNKTPLVLMAGQQHRALHLGLPFLHAEQATSFPLPYVKWSCEPARAQDVPAAIAQGYLLAMQPPRGPVFVSVPLDDWEEKTQPVSQRRVEGSPEARPEALASTARSIDAARSPVIVVGPDVDSGGGFDDAVLLAEKLSAPVWAAPRSPRASFPEDHPLFAGFLPFDPAGVRGALGGHDLVLVLGAPVFTVHVHSEGPMIESGCELIQLTDDPAEAARASLGSSVVGAVAPAIRRLTELVEAGTPPPRGREQTPVPAAPASGEPMSGEFVIHQLSRLLPRETVLVEEAPSHRHAMHDLFPIRRGQSFYTGASGGLGWAMPAAVGIKLAEPDRPVACLIGDGSSMYSPQALWSAAEYDVPVIFIVMNNRGYGSMRGFSARYSAQNGTGEGISYDIDHLDLVLIANAQGCQGERVSTPEELEQAIERALGSDRPTLLDIPLAPQAPTVA